jgi:hypothetical protein
MMVVEVGSDEDDEHDNGLLVCTENEIMKIGLRLVGFSRRRLRRAKKKTNLDRFRGHFGSNPKVIAETLEDLQTTEVEEAHVPSEELNINHFLMAMHHLKGHPTEMEREPIFDFSVARQGALLAQMQQSWTELRTRDFPLAKPAGLDDGSN